MSGGQRFDLQAVDRGNRVAIVHQVVRQREAGRAQTDDQNLVAAGRRGQTGARNSAGSSA